MSVFERLLSLTISKTQDGISLEFHQYNKKIKAKLLLRGKFIERFLIGDGKRKENIIREYMLQQNTACIINN